MLTVASPAEGFQTESSEIPGSTQPAAPDPEYSPHGPYFGPLALPHIVRYRELPMRMHLEPIILPPDNIYSLDERMLPLFERVVKEARDLEVQEVAALSLARVGVENIADISHSEAALREVLKTSESERVRNACGYALAAGNMKAAELDLVSLAFKSDDPQRQMLEPALARWKAASAADLWRPRLTDPFTSTVSFRLAAEGLTALNDVSASFPLNTIVADSTAVFAKRMAAAEAIAALSPEQAFSSAELLITGRVTDKLLAIALLDSTKAESPVRTVVLCDDAADAVAAAAWQQVFRRHPESLIDYLPTGRIHRDAQIRMTAARTMELFPTAERATWLHQQLSDIHIEVRNVARQMLVEVAEENADLKEQIVGMASDMLKAESKDWQGIEQSLILLGQLRATQFSPQCVPLLDYPRDEVNVSASWLIQLFPDDTIRDAMLSYIEKNEKIIATPGLDFGGAAQKEALLINYAGLVRLREIQPILESKFNKMAPGGYEVRGAAMWALGIFFEKNPVPELATRFEERIKDRQNVPPEYEYVRRMSVLALGLMRSKASVEVVREAYKMDPGDSLIPGTARWVLPLLGEPLPAEIPPNQLTTGGWRLNPVGGP